MTTHVLRQDEDALATVEPAPKRTVLLTLTKSVDARSDNPTLEPCETVLSKHESLALWEPAIPVQAPTLRGGQGLLSQWLLWGCGTSCSCDACTALAGDDDA